MRYNYDKSSEIQGYVGLPKNQNKNNTSLWKKFLKSILPWVTKKWELGNAYLEAKVEKEKNEAHKIKNEADKISVETKLLQIQAEKEIREIIEMADYQDDLNAIKLKAKGLSDHEIDLIIKEFSEKLKLFHIKYGLRISISFDIDQDDSLLG